jgi:hypothetical protein
MCYLCHVCNLGVLFPAQVYELIKKDQVSVARAPATGEEGKPPPMYTLQDLWMFVVSAEM